MAEAESGWYKDRLEVFATLGLMTFTWLMFLLVCIAVLVCFHMLWRGCVTEENVTKQGERQDRAKDCRAPAKDRATGTQSTTLDAEREKHSQMMEKGRQALETMLDPRRSS